MSEILSVYSLDGTERSMTMVREEFYEEQVEVFKPI